MFKQGIGDFITGFQFLTRILLFRRHESSEASFGRSVKFFPLIGGIIGFILAGIAYVGQWYWAGGESHHALAICLVIAEIILTGGLHWDGFIDTMDGIFSGRSQERILEIMRDSRVGAFGAIALCLAILARYSFFIDLEDSILPVALIVMPVAGRTAIVMAVTFFSYARREGLGKVFPQHASHQRFYIAVILAVVIVVPLGLKAILSAMGGFILAVLFACYVNRRLGGLTGDVYGAVNEVAELMVLFIFMLEKHGF